ncbi:MAG: ABC transporter permease subunit [Deltaproteobacteria bacterium]|nr:ABC transporter permease subunit [Deltaproteobacteria bacterium]
MKLAGRILSLPLVFLCSTLLVFALARLADPEATGTLLGAYADWLLRLVRLDLGTSSRLLPGAPVAEVAAGGLLLSLGLAAAGLAFSTAIATAFAWRASRRPDPTGPGAGGVLLLLASAVPAIVIAYLARDVVNPLVAALAERGAIESPRPYLVGMGAGPVQYALAALTLGVGDAFLAHLGFTLKDEAARVRARDFVHAAELNGGPVARHVAGNLVVPALATLAARLPALLGGVVVVETAYSLNGAGRVLWRAALEGDTDVLLAVTVMLTAVVVAVRLLVEVASAAWDPRLAR